MSHIHLVQHVHLVNQCLHGSSETHKHHFSSEVSETHHPPINLLPAYLGSIMAFWGGGYSGRKDWGV